MTITDEGAGLGGVFAAALTPMNDDLSVDHAGFARHCRWLLKNGCDGLAILGTTGEANSFSVAERIALLEKLVEAEIPAHRLVPGTGCCAVPDTVELSRAALALGAAGILVLPPFYYKNVSDEGVFAAYSEVIERLGDDRLRLYLYHFPRLSGVPISLGLIERLLKAYPGSVAGVKDSSGDLANMEAMVSAFPGFRVFAGTETHLLTMLRRGGAGCISATVNVDSALAAKVYAASQTDAAEALQAQLTGVRQAIEAVALIPALKAIMERHTGTPGWRNMRPPTMALPAAAADKLFADLDALGFTLADAA